MKKEYLKPELVEYEQLRNLTGGDEPLNRISESSDGR
jgi:hypothetical protein